MNNLIINQAYPTLQLTSDELDKGAKCFQSDGFLRIKNFFHPELVRKLHEQFPESEFTKSRDGRSLVNQSQQIQKLNFLMMVPDVLRQVRLFTKTPSIDVFSGRIYQFDQTEHQFGWHADTDANKLIAVSINLSLEPFAGGELEIRMNATGEIERIHNTGIGDAVIFYTRGDHLHRVLPLRDHSKKVAFAGWYFPR